MMIRAAALAFAAIAALALLFDSRVDIMGFDVPKSGQHQNPARGWARMPWQMRGESGTASQAASGSSGVTYYPPWSCTATSASRGANDYAVCSTGAGGASTAPGR